MYLQYSQYYRYIIYLQYYYNVSIIFPCVFEPTGIEILKQPEFRLDKKQREYCKYNPDPFDLTRNRIAFVCVH